MVIKGDLGDFFACVYKSLICLENDPLTFQCPINIAILKWLGNGDASILILEGFKQQHLWKDPVSLVSNQDKYRTKTWSSPVVAKDN